MSQQLDRGKPLWEMWIVEGLSEGRWGSSHKVHHCMVDGVSGTELLAVILDSERDPKLPDPDALASGAPALGGGAGRPRAPRRAVSPYEQLRAGGPPRARRAVRPGPPPRPFAACGPWPVSSHHHRRRRSTDR